MIKRNADGSWDLSSDLSKDSLIKLADALQAAAHEGVGNKKEGKKFIIRFNGREITIESNRELWMFAMGLESAFYAKPVEKPKTTPKKEKVKSDLEEWDDNFQEAEKQKKMN